MNEQLWKRIKSLLWRAGMMALAVFIDYVASNLGILDLPVWGVGVLGLALGELSKYLNTKKVE